MPLDRLGVPVALGAGVEREAEHADRVRLPQPEKRHRHREVLVDPRELHRLRRTSPRRRGLVGSGSSLAVGERGWRSGEHAAELLLVDTRRRCALRSAMKSDAGCWP